jgi:hypothetical protein
MLSSYSILGYPSKKRGVIVFLKHSSGYTISKLQNHNNHDTLLFELQLPDTTKFNILAVYAPSKALPTFWDDAHQTLNTGDNMPKILIGDYNCTINHPRDSEGYETDPHTKSRKVIQSLLDNEELVDA